MRPRAAASIGPEGPLAGPSPTCQLRWSSSSPTGVGDERRPLRITARLGGLCKDFRVRRLYESVKRSEEHTSELQSLMRISYAVFCLKKKKTKTSPNSTKETL